MALNLRLTIEGSDIKGNNAEVRVYLQDFAGTAVTRNGAPATFEIIWGDSQNKTLPLVYGSQANIRFFALNDYEFTDLFATNASDVYIEIELTDTSAIIWKGYIEPEKWSEPLIAPPYEVSFTAYDGLGLLKKVDFLNESLEPYTGDKTPLEILRIILAKTGLSLPLNTRVNIRPGGQSTGFDALTQVVKDVISYNELDCYEVLENLFLNCRIFQRAGEWFILSNDNFANTTINCFAYTAAGATNGTKTINTRFTGWWFEGIANMEIMPAIKQVNIIQDFGYIPNLIQNGNFTNLVDGALENWTATNVTVQQRELDDKGNKFIYINGKEVVDPWTTSPRSKYLASDGITVKASTSVLNIELAYALMGAKGSSSEMYFGVQLVTDPDGLGNTTTYTLRVRIPAIHASNPPDDTDPTEIEFEYYWQENVNKTGIPLKAKVRSSKTGSTWNREIRPLEVDAYPYNEIQNKFTSLLIAVDDGIPADGTMYMYLFGANTADATVAGACFSKALFKLTDEDNNELPTQTEFSIINNAGNNYTPEDWELVNGDVPDIPNRLTAYNGTFKLASDGSATDLWQLDGNVNTYTWAELMARLTAAEARLARQSYQADLADVQPTTAMVFTDPDNSNMPLVEAGITYNFRMCRLEGHFVEIKSLTLTGYTKSAKLTYTQPDGSQTTGGSQSTTAVEFTDTDEKVGFVDTEDLEEFTQLQGYLNKYYFNSQSRDGQKIYHPIQARTGWDLNYNSNLQLSFTSATRTFSIQPTGTSFYYYIQDVRYQSTGATVVIDNTEGLWFIYFSGTTLIASQTPWSIQADDAAFIAVVYWDATNAQIVGDLQPELHTWNMNAAVHDYLHNTFGTRYASGLAVALNGTTLLDVTAGIIFDEDIKIQITDNDTPAAWWQQPLTPLTSKILYRTGAGVWRENAASQTPVIITANTLQFNQYSGATWSLQPVSNNKYVAYWVVATGMITNPVIIIPGQEEGDAISDAQDGNSVLDMQMGSLPSAEHKVIARLIIQATVAAPYYELIEVNDYRNASDEPNSTFNPTNHSSLQGLTNQDHPAAAIYTDTTNFTEILSATEDDVQKALEKIDAEIPKQILCKGGRQTA